MKHRFLILELNHTILVVDITSAGLPTEIYPAEGKPGSMPSLRFQSWNHAEQYLTRLGTTQEVLGATADKIKKAGVAVMTIT